MKKNEEKNLKLKDINEKDFYNIEDNKNLLEKIQKMKINKEKNDHIILSKKFLSEYFK